MKREVSNPEQAARLTPASFPSSLSGSYVSRFPHHVLRFTRHVARFIPRRIPLAAAWPVVIRELRAEARNPFNYLLRVLGGIVVMAVFAVMMADQSGNAAQLGARLFHELNQALYAAIVIAVPMLTADCISREKREGTLGLLFLTPLKAHDIVVGKSLTHTVRAFTLLLAVLPVVLLPFLLGGVSAQGVLGAVTLNLSAVCLALSAGLLASMRNVEWIRAVVYAEILSFGFAFLFRILSVGVFSTARWLAGAWAGLVLNYLWLSAFAIFACSILYAGANLNRIWQEETVAPPQPRWVNLFADSEFWRSAFRWNKRRTLDRNPIAWLQEYSWTARLTKWGWCGLVFIAECVLLLNDRWMSYSDWQMRLGFCLALGLAFSAAGSFRRERQSGALELLLVTPLRPRHLVGGRIWGVWCHFFPAFAILLFIWVFNPLHWSWRDRGLTWFFFCTFLTLPVIGMCFSLSRLHFLVSWLAASALGIWLPYAIGLTVGLYTGRRYGMRMVPFQVMCYLQVCLGLGAWLVLHRNLKRRTFALERATT